MHVSPPILVTPEFAVDENTPNTFYADSDGDGYGNPDITISNCGAPIGYTDNSLDCNDSDSNVYPGNIEVCDLMDNDRNGEIDEFVTITFYADLDGDGYGDLTNTTESWKFNLGSRGYYLLSGGTYQCMSVHQPTCNT